ncbi:MAG: cation transporter [Nitrospira sp.]|nr:cation transporter [Nitrospira sp.]
MTPRFWFQQVLSTAFLVVGLFISLPASATPPIKERLPLTMSGTGCSEKEAEINKLLQAIPGVLSVDFNRIPDHVLVDITPSSVKPEDVLNRVNDAASSWHCKVEIIEGCISAKMPTAPAAPHQHE